MPAADIDQSSRSSVESKVLDRERVFVYFYFAYVVIVSIAAIEWGSHNSMELSELQPALGYVVRVLGIAMRPALLGILVCPISFVVLASTRRLSWPAVVCCLALLYCSALTMITAIQ